ncbi:hypothetical protein LCGC14_1995280 [marine sediment metagenome]|uniref:Uncharacterized protein n=1 Tax=marine sediment metagenome TaxID=412755 RepID=A0A0F9F4Q1_9ZZZZ
MPDTTKYYGWDTGLIHDWLDQDDQSAQADFIQGHQSTSVILIDKAGVSRAAQTIRLVAATGDTKPQGRRTPASAGEEIDIVLVGRRDHPTLADFAVVRGDRFAELSVNYEVLYVDKTFPGYTVAQCIAVQ